MIHPHIHTPFYCFEMRMFTLSRRQDFTIYREVDVPIFLVSLIKLGDASIKSSLLGTGIYFCQYSQLRVGGWWKALWMSSQNSLSPAQLFSAVPPICLQLQSLCNQNIHTTCSLLYTAEWMMADIKLIISQCSTQSSWRKKELSFVFTMISISSGNLNKCIQALSLKWMRRASTDLCHRN